MNPDDEELPPDNHGAEEVGEQTDNPDDLVADPMGVQQASPEEQDQYDKFLSAASDILYDENMKGPLLDMLDGAQGQDGGNPAEGLAMATVMIVGRVSQVAQQAGEQLDPVVVFHAGTEIMGHLADMSAAAGIKDYSEDPKALQGAYFRAIDLYIEQARQRGEIDDAAAAQQLQRLLKADSDGELDKLMRELAAGDENGSGSAGEQEARPSGGMDRGAPPPPPPSKPSGGGFMRRGMQ